MHETDTFIWIAGLLLALFITLTKLLWLKKIRDGYIMVISMKNINQIML